MPNMNYVRAFRVVTQVFTDKSETYHVQSGDRVIASSNHFGDADRLMDSLNIAIESFLCGDPSHVNTIG
jgi:hypothetical protein